MDHSKNQQHHQHHLGVNKLGKSIRKSPLHQPSFARPPAPLHHQQPPQQPPPPPQPQVYNISKSDFRSIVQQLTGTPSRDPNPNSSAPPPNQPLPPPARPPQPKAPSVRLQKIRPPPLTPIARPPPPPLAAYANPNPHHPIAHPNPHPHPHPHHNPSFFPRPGPGPAYAESPVSAYMRYLESSLLSSDSSRQLHHSQPPLPSPGLLPSPQLALFPSPRANALPPNAPLLPSPGSQYTVPSPSAFLNLVSPKSPYPLLSPGFQYPPPLTPNFSFSPLAHPGILGPGPGSQPPPPPSPSPSPGLMFPPSPSGFLPLLSPRWRDM